ncbi:MAG: transcriptional regulator [Halalkalicoccus sp.]
MPEPRGPPAFDAPFEGEDVEQRIYGVVLRTRTPTSAAAIAEEAECDPKTARKYLAWFADLGVVTAHEGRPRTYERNEAYFEWRRVNELASTRSIGELRRRVSELSERIDAYRDRYGAETPGEVDALERDDSDVDGVYEDLADWATALGERRLSERARRQLSDSTARTHG